MILRIKVVEWNFRFLTSKTHFLKVPNLTFNLMFWQFRIWAVFPYFLMGVHITFHLLVGMHVAERERDFQEAFTFFFDTKGRTPGTSQLMDFHISC